MATSPMVTHVPVLVIGAGISGLVCAHALRKAGMDAQLVECSPRPGGLIRSESRNGYLLELGPQSFTATSQLRQLCRDLAIENDILEAPPRAPRFLLLGGRLRPAPLSPAAFFASSLFSLRTKLSILRDVFGRSTPPDSDESVADFTRRKFSAELLEKLVGPFVSGIYAGDAEKLSLRAAFPSLHEAEQSAGSIIRGMIRASKSKKGPREKPTLLSFRNGNETLVRSLAANLGAALRLGAEVMAIQQGGLRLSPPGTRFLVDIRTKGQTETVSADRLILATPADVTAKLLKSIEPGIDSVLGQTQYAPVAVVSLGYRKSDVGHSLDGFGFLVPRSEGLRTLGTVWNSSLFPGRVPPDHVLLTSFVAGTTDPAAGSLPSSDLVSLVHKEIAPILSIRQPPAFSHVQKYERALPQYTLGHAQRIADLQRLVSRTLNLWLVGNYFRGPAIGACVEQALDVANQVCASMSPSS